MFARDKSIVPDLSPEMIDAVYRNARRERAKAFHGLIGSLAGALFRSGRAGGQSKAGDAQIPAGYGVNARPC